MNTISKYCPYLLLAPAVLISAILSPASAAAAPITGAQVLDNCQAAYASLNSYQGEVTALETSKTPGVVGHELCTAHITFERPSRIRVDGTGFKLGLKVPIPINYAYVSDGTTTETNALGQWSHALSSLVAIGAATGIGLHSATTVPSLLLQRQYFSMGGYVKPQDQVLLSASNSVNGHSCFVVDVMVPYNVTYYVDKKTWLLVKVIEDLPNIVQEPSKSGVMQITLNMQDPVLNKAVPWNTFVFPKVKADSPILDPH